MLPTNRRAVVGGPTKPFYLEPDLRYGANEEQSSSGPSCPDRYRGSSNDEGDERGVDKVSYRPKTISGIKLTYMEIEIDLVNI